MKPEILSQPLPTAGYHNQDPGRTRSRLEKAAAWKRQRVLVLVPAGKSIATKVYLTHRNLIMPPNNPHYWIVAKDVEVGKGYTKMIEEILAHPEFSQWEYILTLEHDNMPPQDGLLRLIEQMEVNPRYACIGGLYFTKGYGGHAQIWGDPKDPILNFRPQLPDPAGGLVECNGTGMGFNLWRLKMFKDKKLRRPWFVTEPGTTQDLYFWMDAKKHGYRCAIDCGVKVGHYDIDGDFVW